MVIMITRARVFGHRRDVLFAAAIFLAVALTTGGLAGAALGSLGQLLGLPTRAVVGVVGLGGIAVIAVSRKRPWQLDRETKLDWLLLQDWRTAAYNAASLSLGFATRIGFWAFFLVPVGAFISGDPRVGALVYATYAVTRTLASFALAAVSFRSIRFVDGVQRLYAPVRAAGDVTFFAAVGYLLAAMAKA